MKEQATDVLVFLRAPGVSEKLLTYTHEDVVFHIIVLKSKQYVGHMFLTDSKNAV